MKNKKIFKTITRSKKNKKHQITKNYKMEDYPYLFEKTIVAYLGYPENEEYIANWFGDNFETRAILFSIATYELLYTKNESSILKNYCNKNGETSHDENVEVLEFLANQKEIK